LYYLEGKTLNGKNSLDHLLSKGASQSERICVDIIGTNDTNYISSSVEKVFQDSITLKEILLFKGTRLITVTRQQAEYKDFNAMFKKIWLKNK
jgi:uncharacterized HAD superfamily protein